MKILVEFMLVNEGKGLIDQQYFKRKSMGHFIFWYIDKIEALKLRLPFFGFV